METAAKLDSEITSTPPDAPWGRAAHTEVSPAMPDSMDRLGRPATTSGRSAPDPAVERLAQLLADEARHLKDDQSGSLAVSLALQDGTELFVHFVAGADGVGVDVRCEEDAWPRLNPLWPRLGDALASGHLRLQPLRILRAEGRRGSILCAEPIDPAAHHSGRQRSGSRRNGFRSDWNTWA